MFIRSPYNYDMSKASDESALHCLDDSLTIQSAAEEADINTIVRRFGLTGELPDSLSMPQSGDFVGAVDFHTAQNLVVSAQAEFLKVPADVRARFNHDAGAFMAFCEDNGNYDEAKRLGLLKPPVEAPAPVSVRVVPDVAAKPV